MVPHTRATKIFLSFYSLIGTLAFTRVVGAVALRPLEAARRAAQVAVLERYGGVLTPETLTTLARGATVKRLQLSVDDSYCTRDEFTLLTLVEQGKVTEADLDEIRDTFDVLDVNGNGILSREDLPLAFGSESEEPTDNSEQSKESKRG